MSQCGCAPEKGATEFQCVERLLKHLLPTLNEEELRHILAMRVMRGENSLPEDLPYEAILDAMGEEDQKEVKARGVMQQVHI